MLNGGTDYEYFEDVCAGDILTATMKISDIAEREGKMGPMLIVSTETTYKNQAGDDRLPHARRLHPLLARQDPEQRFSGAYHGSTRWGVAEPT